MKRDVLKFVFLFLLFSSSVLAKEYALISNKNMHKLSLNEIKAIYLKKVTFAGKIKVLPLNLSSRDSIRANFEKKVLKMNFSRLKSYWTKQHYLGRRPPLTMKSQEAIKTFVKKVDGAIGYIDIQNLDESVKVLYTWKD
ncbi:MAG: hypothetical protein Q9M34_09155 [Sulfurimonas sp.]|nr:hypothetical protein [Sulfurimonas sp.]